MSVSSIRHKCKAHKGNTVQTKTMLLVEPEVSGTVNMQLSLSKSTSGWSGLRRLIIALFDEHLKMTRAPITCSGLKRRDLWYKLCFRRDSSISPSKVNRKEKLLEKLCRRIFNSDLSQDMFVHGITFHDDGSFGEENVEIEVKRFFRMHVAARLIRHFFILRRHRWVNKDRSLKWVHWVVYGCLGIFSHLFDAFTLENN